MRGLDRPPAQRASEHAGNLAAKAAQLIGGPRPLGRDRRLAMLVARARAWAPDIPPTSARATRLDAEHYGRESVEAVAGRQPTGFSPVEVESRGQAVERARASSTGSARPSAWLHAFRSPAGSARERAGRRLQAVAIAHRLEHLFGGLAQRLAIRDAGGADTKTATPQPTGSHRVQLVRGDEWMPPRSHCPVHQSRPTRHRTPRCSRIREKQRRQADRSYPWWLSRKGPRSGRASGVGVDRPGREPVPTGALKRRRPRACACGA
jgi:hypothetical protein